MTPQTAE